MYSQNMQVACVAIIGPDGNPLLIEKKCEEKQEHEIDSLLFCSLDFFDQPTQRKIPKLSDRYLGNIQTSERFQIWGYKAGLGYKIIVLTFHVVNLQDNFMKSVCEKIKDVLFDAILDPFYTPFSMIESPSALSRINEIAATVQAPQQ
ncbi:trafficking protein particle complex subunit 2-like protein [Histomonas meleagridis]|uniref:trafficking protein particle complex subunit 2-like protein n=1 Tax=Histomonas meleagridis TaxID=135588 RepID=UPI00355A6F02|nr:trafficking protein particle complex subunit 2-like protein [Histomonas meleagridis]KAH0797864.1 trafficking protein particle complex subunit 2-like protein [Histomonas meleagridis]